MVYRVDSNGRVYDFFSGKRVIGKEADVVLSAWRKGKKGQKRNRMYRNNAMKNRKKIKPAL